MVHYTFLDPLIADANSQKLVVAVLLGTLAVVVSRSASARLKTAQGIEAAIVPASKLSLFGTLDFVVESFVKFQDSILGKENRKFAPFTGALFVFILLSNLLGLVPGMPAIATTVWVNVGMAFVVFAYFNVQGVKANGLLGYIKHFCGPVMWLAWLIFPVEVLGACIRILTLNLRLYWNISADHLMVGVFTDLIKFSFPFYFMGLFVAFMQAFVFTTLTMIYILLATQHGEEEGHH